MPHLWGGWIISSKDKCSLTDLDRFVNNIWEKYAFCVHRKSLRSEFRSEFYWWISMPFLTAHEKWGQKQKCDFCFLWKSTSTSGIKNIITNLPFWIELRQVDRFEHWLVSDFLKHLFWIFGFLTHQSYRLQL